MGRQVWIGLILLRGTWCEHDNEPSGFQTKKERKKKQVSQLAEQPFAYQGVCSMELNNTILMSLVTDVDTAAYNFQQPHSYVHIKIYKFGLAIQKHLFWETSITSSDLPVPSVAFGWYLSYRCTLDPEYSINCITTLHPSKYTLNQSTRLRANLLCDLGAKRHTLSTSLHTLSKIHCQKPWLWS